MLGESHFGNWERYSLQGSCERGGIIYGEALVGNYVFFFFVGEILEIGDWDIFITEFLVIFAGGRVAVALVDTCKVNLVYG